MHVAAPDPIVHGADPIATDDEPSMPTPHPSHAWWRGDNELEAPRTAIGGSGNPMLTRRPPVEARQPSDETTQPSNQTTQPSDQTKQTRDGGRQQPAQVKRPRDELRRHRAKEIRPTIRGHCSQ